MKTLTITVSEYATRYGCSTQFVTRMLRKDKGMVGMVSWRKLEGKTCGWLIEVLCSWYENPRVWNCPVCKTDHNGDNKHCNDCINEYYESIEKDLK